MITTEIHDRYLDWLVEASDGVDALRLLEEAPDRVRVVLADLVMPKLGGADLHAAVRSQYPPIGFVIMTGHGAEAVAEGLPPGVMVLDKPYSKASLLRAIRTSLFSEVPPHAVESTRLGRS